jgi:SAM-dependent methyltransferase
MDFQTIQTYNRFATEYDQETALFWKEFPREFVERFAKLAPGVVLNVGSGPGRDAQLLKNAGLTVVCFDAAKTMVAKCIEQGFDAVVGDFNHLPFKDGVFAGAWAYCSLIHVPEYEAERALKEMKRVLVPGGVVALGLIVGVGEEYKETTRVPGKRWFSYYDEHQAEELLEHQGFDIILIERYQPRSTIYLHILARVKT